MSEEHIYTVEFESYDGGGIEGIYKTKEEAIDRLKRIEQERNGWFKFIGPDCIKHLTLAEVMDGKVVEGGDRYRIYERRFGDIIR